MTGRACTIYPFVSVKVIELLGPIRRLVAANGLSFVAIQFEELAPLCMGNVRVYIRFTNKKKKKDTMDKETWEEGKCEKFEFR